MHDITRSTPGYYTYVASFPNAPHNHRLMLVCSLLLMGGAIVTMVYAMRRHPRLNYTNWQSMAPLPTATATLSSLTGAFLYVS